ncbi:MAG TPA: hypothetical protein VFW07_07755 [Parafilimonas sp.]|nr:hypothetical protein [Parafilimonas sp.]
MKKTLLTGVLAIALLCCTNPKTFAQTDWHIKGNSGTSPATNFIGTIDNTALSIRTKNSERLRVLPGGNTFLGNNTGDKNISSYNTGTGFHNLFPHSDYLLSFTHGFL